MLSFVGGELFCVLGPLSFYSLYARLHEFYYGFSRYSLGRYAVNYQFVIDVDLPLSVKYFSALGVSFLVSGFRLYSSRWVLPLRYVSSFFIGEFSVVSLMGPVATRGFSVLGVSLGVKGRL